MTATSLLDLEPLRRLLHLLDRDGEEARVVGGAVRDALLGRDVVDHDIATTAVPKVVVARAKQAGLRTIPTGIAHGTVTVLVEGRTFEVTTLREDVETDGRHAVVRFGRDFARDALRRDFTINAMSLTLDGTVHDYAGGRADLEAGRVRFIGDPATRIAEDYLRILRFFRFSASYADGPLDPAGLAAAIAGRAGLDHLSRERVRQELFKLLSARRAPATVTAMAQSGLLGPLLRAVPRPARLGRLLTIDPEADAILRIAAISVVVPEDAGRLREVLRLSNADAARLDGTARGLTTLHGARAAPKPDRLRGLLFDVGRRAARDSLMLAWAESGAGPDEAAWCSASAFLRDTPEPHLPFSGADLMARGIRPGRAMGDALKRLQAAWIRAGFPNDPRSLAALLQDIVDTSH